MGILSIMMITIGVTGLMVLSAWGAISIERRHIRKSEERQKKREGKSDE